jgi:hypothetical protein
MADEACQSTAIPRLAAEAADVLCIALSTGHHAGASAPSRSRQHQDQLGLAVRVVRQRVRTYATRPWRAMPAPAAIHRLGVIGLILFPGEHFVAKDGCYLPSGPGFESLIL